MTIENEKAAYILRTIARARLQPAPDAPPLPELRALLTRAFDEPVPSAVAEGELAQAALAVLAENPEFAEPIRVMASQADPPPRQYLEPTTIAVTTAALLALQTRIQFKRDQNSKWSLVIDKKAASDAFLKVLVLRLLSLFPK